MNYRHAFHAGNFADVLKHATLALALDRLNAKAAPWRYIDTHGGIGEYDLTSEEATRNPEWRDGVERVWLGLDEAPPDVQDALRPWMQVLKRLNPDRVLKRYPGSPKVAHALARDNDQIRLCELHDADVLVLQESMFPDRRVKIEHRDGYEALPAFLPPPERRGLVLVDPPFEEGPSHARKDFHSMLVAADRAMKRWSSGCYVFWRPLKHLESAERFDGDLATRAIERHGLAPEKIVTADLWVRELGSPGPLAGAGVILINPPYGLESGLAALLPWLARCLETERGAGGWRLGAAMPEAGEADL